MPVLKRKLDVVKTNYKKSPLDYEKYSLIALMSLYGVDLLEDNVQICRDNLYDIWNEEYTRNAKQEATERVREIAKYILKKNIFTKKYPAITPKGMGYYRALLDCFGQ